LGTCSWESVPGNLLLGTLLGNLFLGTLLGNVLGNLTCQPVLGNLVWAPVPVAGNLAWETLPRNLAWEPLPGNPVPNLAPCGLGCSEGFSWKAAPTYSGTFTMAEDPKLTLLGNMLVMTKK